MKKSQIINFLFCIAFVLFMSVVYAAAAQVEKNSAAVKKAPTVRATVPGKAAWEEEWARTLAAAKKEGVVSFYAQWSPQTRGALRQAFKDKYGITIEFMPFSRVEDI